MNELWLSHARLRRDVDVGAVLARLRPSAETDAPVAPGLRDLVSTLFTGPSDRRRDFLWREEGCDRLTTLSARPPTPRTELFETRSRAIALRLAAGDRLGFTLRASPMVARPGGCGHRGERYDVVMDALQAMPRDSGLEARLCGVTVAGREWLARQGRRRGFEVEPCLRTDGYRPVGFRREDGTRARFSQLNLSGSVVVTDPALFVPALLSGFGRARALGYGLMLIKRA
jgi:CRISPR system Cascade subunit CasE